MASLYKVPPEEKHKFYKDYWDSFEDQLRALETSSTVYVGNLPLDCSQDCIYDFFSRCGIVERVIMGVNKFSGEQCGFCFVV